MPTLYMLIWSIIIILALSLWRLRNLGQIFIVVFVTALTLILSQSLFIQLAISAGVDPSMVLTDAGQFLAAGPTGWLALLVMPCGWLGPILGLSLSQHWREWQQEMS